MPCTCNRYHNCKGSKQVAEWCGELKNDKDGLKIFNNFECETNLEDNYFEIFYKRIAASYPKPVELDSKVLIEQCADKPEPLTFKGPKDDQSEKKELYRLVLAEKLLLPIIKKSGKNYSDVKDFINDLKDGIITTKDFMGEYIKNNRGIVWATWKEEVIKAEMAGDDLDTLRNRMGLAHYKKGADVIELTYSNDENKVKDICIPTVLDAGNNSYFKPGGKTQSLVAGKDGLPEVVHRSVSFENVSLNYKGKIQTTAPGR